MFRAVETKEAAFVYALTSATIVHAVAQLCAHYGNSLSSCGCYSGLDDETLEAGETWGCSPDIDFSMNFTRQLVEGRNDNDTPKYKAFVLHNSKIGQLVRISNNI